jgi:ribosome biogenesis GTPase A
VTKAQQRIKLDNNVILTDTPGFLWPKLSPASCGYRLAITGGIKDTAFDYADIAMFAADYLLKTYPKQVMARYQLTEQPENDLALLDAIGQRRGCMVKGGIVDLTKAGTILITELRSGLFGPISLETPDMVTQELADAKLEQARIEKEKAAREQERARKAKKKYR